MRIIVVLTLFIASILTNAQSVIGAWEAISTAENGDEIKRVVIFSDSHFASTEYDLETGEFQSTHGGSYILKENNITETFEFHSLDPSKVGERFVSEIAFDGNDRIRIEEYDIWLSRIDDGNPGKLAGAWLISGRMRNGEIRERSTESPRKTMKILSGTRFQWIAYNTETKQFMGTGGGTYSSIDGKYTENIHFFSKDSSRVGASIVFNFDIKNGEWHHSGNNSRGEPLYEVWSLRDK